MPCVAMEIACHQLIVFRALRRTEPEEDWHGRQQEPCLQVKKLLDDNVDWGSYSEGVERSDPSRMSSRSCRFRLQNTSIRWQRGGQPQNIPRDFKDSVWSPAPIGHFLMENMSFGRFSTGHATITTRLLLAEFWTLAD